MQRYVIFLLLFEVVLAEKTCDSVFSPPYLEKRKITIERDIPLRFIGRDVDSGCNCRESPEIYSVCYNINQLTPCSKFPRNITITTKTLILKTTHITQLKHGDFSGLEHLETLTIDNNQYLSSVQPFVFENMKNLTTLSFISNPLLTIFHPQTFYGLVSLKELNLVKNGFQNIDNLALAMRVQVLPALLKINLKENSFPNITETDFEAMTGSKVDELNLVSCEIEEIHPYALNPLKSLKILRLGNNNLNVKTLEEILSNNIKSGINLKVLDLYSSGLRGSMLTSLLKIISQTNISSLMLRRNQFSIIDSELFSVYNPKLTLLDLTDVSAQKIHDQAFSKLPNLKTLILAKNKLPFFIESKHLPNLTYLDLQKNTDSYGWEFSLNKSDLSKMKLQYLDLQFTRLLGLSKTDFGQMPCLRILNLKNCSVLRIEKDSFRGMPKLSFLNLDYNLFFKMWMISKNDSEIFGGLENLEVLMLEGNSISTLRTPTKHLLTKLKNLKHLSLNKNHLQTISWKDFAHLEKLEALEISENRIISWDSRVFLNIHLKKFYAAYNKITRISEAMIQDFQHLELVDLDFNSFICDCFMMKRTSNNKSALIRFTEIIKNQQLYCLRPNSSETVSNFLQNIILSKMICDPESNFYYYIFSLLLVVVIFLIIMVFGYIYRWHIRYWLFLIRIYLIRKGKARKSEVKTHSNFQFDAFVSYCHQDQNFVIKLVRILENNDPFFRLCIYERDFQVGSYISESILENISKSRKTILIVSDSYARSYWCNWETQIAEHHRLFSSDFSEAMDQSIVVIKVGQIDETHLNPTLKYLLKTRIYLEWDPDEEKQMLFWKKLRQFLMPPKSDIMENTYL